MPSLPENPVFIRRSNQTVTSAPSTAEPSSMSSASASSTHSSSTGIPGGAIAGIILGAFVLISFAGIVGFYIFRSRHTKRKELEEEQQKALVEEFIAVSRDASRNASVDLPRGGGMREVGERSMAGPYLSVEGDRQRMSTAPSRPSRLSIVITPGERPDTGV
ncbi:hypothetical protein FN846DRAFT_942503 [Sphaerosporella brunnea]|uniref:Uncharacterized protein n=1 Tax=Sphaerosporella brunnea TaxID=1250544 RepID=A0A5J5F0X5_9PEZI|nr:hypothetical protein FN846DRAFT_942503 [Sphaerosporella brunnea]